MIKLRTLTLGVAASLVLNAAPGAQEGKVQAGAASGKLPAADVFKPGQFTSDEVCAPCHRDIYSVWKGKSVHSRSLNMAFMQAYQEANAASGGKTRALCLTCHAPTTVVTKDYDLKQPITREGITCDFCHSLKGVRVGDTENLFDLDPGPVKRGPLKRPEPTIHQVVKSDLHSSAELCASCHEYRNANGAALMTTYSEWQAGPYSKEGVTCQGCHMPLFKGELVETQKTGQLDRIFINLHATPGGHDLDQLQRAVRMNITEVRRDPERTLVRVEVINDGAGHKVPTGLPSRRLVLRASVQTPGGKLLKQERVFQKVVLDAARKPLDKDSRLFLEGVSIREDNRIGPREQRVEAFEFPVPRIHAADLKVQLIYDYLPMTGTEKRVETEIFSVGQKLAKE